MAKKKTTSKKNTTKNKELEDIDEELFSADIEEEYPDTETKEEEKPQEEVSEEEEEIQKIPIKEEKFYKYLNLKLNKIREKDYELSIEGQTHGFCNILVKYLLDIEGVEIAAYKSTTIEPSKVFIRLKNGFDIKKIISEGVSLLEEEVIKLQKAFIKNF